jgi:WD40 repeat protein
MPAPTRLSLADLCAAPVQLRPEDISSIVHRLCLHAAEMTVTPTDRVSAPLGPQHVWLDHQGDVHLAPGIWPTVRDLGALLEQLLGELRRHGTTRIPPGLVIAAARATGTIDAAPLLSIDTFARALERFVPPDSGGALRTLFQVGTQPFDERAAPTRTLELVISDRPAVESVVRVKRGRRHVAATLIGASAFAVGVTAAVLLQPREPVRRATDATEVTIATSGGGEPRRAPSKLVQPDRSTPRNESGHRARATRPIAPPVLRDRTSAAQSLIEPAAAGADAAFSPSFDSHGTAVFFHAQSGSTSALKRAERDESGVLHVVTIVDDAAKNYHVQLSPDARSVAFDSDRDGIRGVYMANANGGDVRRVSGPGYAAVPTWSPDGKLLAFVRAENDKPRVWNLWVKDLSSNVIIRLTNHAYGQVWGGAWFPDGRRIAYSHEDRLVVMSLDSERTTTYPSPRQGRLVRTPAVSPDGRWIVFQVFRDGAWLLDLKSGSMRRALDDPSAEEFTWTPDGRRVAFHSRRSGEWGLCVMAPR